MSVDAVVVGAGPNGLVAANVLADAGWSVEVVEANEAPGGAVRSEHLAHPDFLSDVFSAFYPMTAASPVIAELELEEHGLRWTHAPTVLAHPRADGGAFVLHRDVDVTAESLERASPGDGDRYRQLFARWQRVSEPLMHSLLRPFPPVRPAARLLRAAGITGTIDLARLALLTVRRFAEEEFRGEGGGLLLAGNALHADLTPDSSGSALFGWMLCGLGQEHGFPVPVGGAQAITDALVRRATSRGVQLRTGAPVTEVLVDARRAAGVRTADGTVVRAGAVLADCDVRALLLGLVGAEHLPAGPRRRLARFQRAAATIKVDWALSSPVPWSDAGVIGAGTVHIADSLDELTTTSAQLSTRRIPDAPFLLVGQMTTADPSRSPAGTESMWAYTHVPQEPLDDAAGEIGTTWSDDDLAAFVDRMERRIERHAPGFTSRIVGRHVLSPADMERRDRNLVGGDISGGTAQLHQQLVFRPMSGWGRAETPIRERACLVLLGPVDTPMFQRAANCSGRRVRAEPAASTPGSLHRPRRDPETRPEAISGGWRRGRWRARVGDAVGRRLARS